MQVHAVEVDNLKCGGCANTIRKGLADIGGIANIDVDPETKFVKFDGPAAIRELALTKLKSMGYPEKGSTHGLEAGLATAKSFVSCAVGRVG